MVPPAEGEHQIPHVVHWLWLGTNPVPRIFEQYAERWRILHPAWQTRLWRDDTLSQLDGHDVLESATGFKRRYDMVRLEILRQHGGVIVDMDVEPIRPLDPLLQGVTAFVGRIGDKHIGNQVLGATPRHPFFERAVQGLRSNAEVGRNSSDIAGKSFLKRLLDQHPEGVTVFPARAFYYEPSFEPPRRPDDFPDVYTVHHQLESYIAGVNEDALQRRLEVFLRQYKDATQTVDQAEAERRLKRAVSRHDDGHRAQLRAANAEIEQAGVRLIENDRQWRQRLEDVEQRLSRALELLDRRERRGLRDRLRKLAGRWRA